MKVGQFELPIGKKTLVMGIVNVTPDSFSDGGRYHGIDAALRHSEQLVADGADILDIGGESTRPYGNNQPISAEEEMERILPVIERLVKEIPVPVSVDTYKAKTAAEALRLGAHIINDVWGLQGDPDMAGVVARYGAPIVVMHNQQQPGYTDLMADIKVFLRRSIAVALEAGIPQESIIVDPGIGLPKTRSDNIMIIRCLRHLEELGCPILLGTSRKTFIGTTLNLPPLERVEGTAATVAIGIANGADIIRVHDVLQMSRVAKMADALVREELG